MNKPLTSLLSLTFLFLFSGSVYGDDSSDFQDGLDATNKGDYKTAFRLWKPLAEQGSARAQNDLGWMYHYGQGVPQDYKEAFKWYRLSAEQGFAKAQNNLALMYDNGQGVPQEY